MTAIGRWFAMMREPTRRVEPIEPGRHRIQLPDNERAVLGDLGGQLRSLLTQGTDGPEVRRLFPTAYADDPERDAEYRDLMSDDLLARRLATADVLESTATATELDDEQLMAWIGAVNDLRLVLGTRLDVSEEDDLEATDGDPVRGIYLYLGWLLEHLMDCAQATLPEQH